MLRLNEVMWGRAHSSSTGIVLRIYEVTLSLPSSHFPIPIPQHWVYSLDLCQERLPIRWLLITGGQYPLTYLRVPQISRGCHSKYSFWMNKENAASQQLLVASQKQLLAGSPQLESVETRIVLKASSGLFLPVSAATAHVGIIGD